MKRERYHTPTEYMVDIDSEYLREMIRERGINQSEMSRALGYCPEYLSNCTCVSRMPIALLELLSDMLDFPYRDALVKKKSKKKSAKKSQKTKSKKKK